MVSLGEADVFVSKLNSSGNFVWAKSFGTTDFDEGFDIALDVSNNVHTTGVFTGTVDFDPGPGTSNLTGSGGGDIFVSKLDTNGNFVWARAMGGISLDEAFAVTVDGSGNVYTTGGFTSAAADFDPGPGTLNLSSAGSFDVFISKLNSSGGLVWAKKLGGSGNDIGRGIVVDGGSHVYTVGDFTDTADFNPGAGTSNLTSVGGKDVFISRLDGNGNYVSVRSFSGASDVIGRDIALSGTGNISTAGEFEGGVDFDPGAGTLNLLSTGQEDIFVSSLPNP